MSSKALCNKSHLHLATILCEQHWNEQKVNKELFFGRAFSFFLFQVSYRCFGLFFVLLK